MRHSIILLAASLMIAACADDQHVTSPNSRASVRSNGDAAPSTQDIKLAQGKPTDQVGFTKITLAPPFTIQTPPGGNSQAISTCPAGSTAIGGTHQVTLYVASATPPLLTFVGLDGQNGYKIIIANEVTGAGNIGYRVTAYCAS